MSMLVVTHSCLCFFSKVFGSSSRIHIFHCYQKVLKSSDSRVISLRSQFHHSQTLVEKLFKRRENIIIKTYLCTNHSWRTNISFDILDTERKSSFEAIFTFPCPNIYPIVCSISSLSLFNYRSTPVFYLSNSSSWQVNLSPKCVWFGCCDHPIEDRSPWCSMRPFPI